MKKIALVGAFDRDNYGDLLFPIIVEEWLNKKQANFRFAYYGLVESDLTHFGGRKTKSIQALYKEKNDGIIIAGGQILNAKWSAMHLNLIENFYLFNTSRIIYKLIGSENANKLAKWYLNGKTTFPWVISNDVSNGAKVIYNAVGGTGFSNYSADELTKLKNSLNSAEYISVRDRLTYDNLRKIGVNGPKLSPDSAIIMSQLFDKSYLKTKLSFYIEKMIDSFETENINYLCFQIGKHYCKGNEQIIANELMRVSLKYNLSIVLLPIGKAAGHEDHIALSKIKAYINNQVEVKLIDDRNIYDIMYIISQSAIFLGTSLHGCITAMSYSVPCISLDKRVVKAREFLKEFSIDKQLYSIAYDQIFDSVEKALSISKEEIQLNTTRIIEIADKNFETIYGILK